MTETNELNESIKTLTKYEKKLASMKWAFWRGVVYGFGFFVGSVILVTALLYVLNKIQPNSNNFLSNFIQKVVETAQSSR